MTTVRRMEKMRCVLQNRQPDLTVVCENIHDPHNVSAILRTCDAVGVQEIHLLYTIEPFPEPGKKSSASAKKWIDMQKHQDYNELRECLKAEGFTIYATGLTGNAVSAYEVDWARPSAIIVGNEHRGVSEEALRISDRIICVPMFGMIESLNVSVATAVILYEAVRQRMAKGLYPRPDITTQWVKEMLENWIKR